MATSEPAISTILTDVIPRRDLLGEEAALSAVLRQIRRVHSGRLDHGCELVTRTPAFGARIDFGKQLALVTGLFPPAVQGRLGYPLILPQSPQRHIVRRQHLLQDSCLALC